MTLLCRRCGECCKKFSLNHQLAHPKTPEELLESHEESKGFLEAHEGIRVLGETVDTLFLEITARCKHLVDNGDGSTSCAVYEKRPPVCRSFHCKKCKEDP